WQSAGRFTGDRGVELTRGNGNLDALVVPFVGSSRRLLEEFVSRFLSPRAISGRLSVSPRIDPVELTGSGLTGQRVSYVGVFSGASSPIEGEVTVAVSGTGAGVIFNGWAPQGLLDYVGG